MQDQRSRSYSELIFLPTFEERFEYLKLKGVPANMTFGGHRYLNQRFYNSPEWKRFRRDVIVRDNGCDLGVDDGEHYIRTKIIIHHINPITIDDINRHDIGVLMDYDNVICVSHKTHEAIHYSSDYIFETYHERTPHDTLLW